MKYLEITKRYYNDPEPTWFLHLKDAYTHNKIYRKVNVLGEKLLGIFNGECEVVKHNKDIYELEYTKFKCNGYPVGLVYKNDETTPYLLWYKGHDGKFTVGTTVIIEEDMTFFEYYGYIVKKFDEVLDDHRK